MKSLLTQLPGSWDELTLHDFMKLSEVEVDTSVDDDVFRGSNNSLAVISALTGVPTIDLESAPLMDITPLLQRISFLHEVPKRGLTRLQWKSLNEITYDNYLTLIQHSKEPFKDLTIIVKSFLKEPMADDEILKLPMSEVHHGFFTLTKSVKKSVNHSIWLSILKLTTHIPRLFQQTMLKGFSRLTKRMGSISWLRK